MTFFCFFLACLGLTSRRHPRRPTGHLRRHEQITFICFLADIGFSVGKLFPGPMYNCDSWSCRKVTHTCTMTLCSCVFGLLEAYLVHAMTKERKTKVPIVLKIVEYSAGLGFILYATSSLSMQYHRILLERAQQCSLCSHPWPRSSYSLWRSEMTTSRRCA